MFVMYCVYGASRSSLLIQSTDFMIHTIYNMHTFPVQLYAYIPEQKVGMLLQKGTDTRGVGISNMRKSLHLHNCHPNF